MGAELMEMKNVAQSVTVWIYRKCSILQCDQYWHTRLVIYCTIIADIILSYKLCFSLAKYILIHYCYYFLIVSVTGLGLVWTLLMFFMFVMRSLITRAEEGQEHGYEYYAVASPNKND